MPLRAILLPVAVVVCVLGFFALVIGVGAMRLSASRDADDGATIAETVAPAPTTAPRVPSATTRPVRTDAAASPGNPLFAVDLPREGGPVSLTASKALVHGKSIKVYNRRNSGESFVGSWHVRDAYAEWSAVVPRAGGYAMELTYACDEGAGGKFELVIGDLAIPGRSEQTDEGGSMVSLGAVELPAGQTRVLLRPAGRIEGELMKLRRIDLFPLDAGGLALAKKAAVRRLPPPGSVITLSARAAKLPDGGPQLEREDGGENVGNWTGGEHVIEWDVASPGGTFHVDLTYACEHEHRWRFAVSVAGRQLHGRTAPTGSWHDYETVRLGAIAIAPGPTRLAIRCTDRELDGYLMNVRRVELIRVNANPATVANAAPARLPMPDEADGGEPARATPVEATLAEPIFLPARLAALRGSEIRYEDDHDGDDNDRSIGFWRDPEEHVEWVVRLAHPARYRVMLSYACATGHGGDVTLVFAGQSLRGRITGEGGWDAPPRTLDLGTVALSAGEVLLLLKPARPMPDGRALMRCRGLLLLPVGE